MRNYHVRAAAAGENVTEADKQSWAAKFAKFIGEGQAEDAKARQEKAKKKEKSTPFNRAAAHDLLQAIDHALKVAIQSGLSAFLDEDEDPVPAGGPPAGHPPAGPPDDGAPAAPPAGARKLKPLLVVCIDQGPDNLAAIWFLLYCVKIRLVIIYDLSHREKNDIKLAIAEANYKNVVDETSLMFNLDYGPWDSAVWFSLTVEGALEMIKTLPPNDKMVQFFSPLMPTPDWQSSIDSASFMEKKVPRMRSVRFFGWMKTAKVFVKEWFLKVMVWIFIGVQLGYFKDAKQFLCIYKRLPANVAANEDGPELPPELQALRKKCKNNLHIAACVGSNESRYYETQQLIAVQDPWYSNSFQLQFCALGIANAHLLSYTMHIPHWLRQNIDLCVLSAGAHHSSHCFSMSKSDLLHLSTSPALAGTTPIVLGLFVIAK